MTQVQPPAIVIPAEKEKILFEVHPNVNSAILTFDNMALVGMIFVIGIIGMVFRLGMWELLVIAVLWILLAAPSINQIFKFGSTGYVLTNQRLLIFTFNFGPKEFSIPLSEIQSADCKFSGLQRFSGGGDIIVHRKGLRKSIRLRAVPNCKGYAKQINQTVKNYKP